MKKIIANLSVMLLMFGLLTSVLGLTDPTKPPNQNEPLGGNSNVMALTAIFIYPTYRIAIINSEAKKVGDAVNTFTITTINQNTVELIGLDDRKETLTLVDTSVRHSR